MASWGCSLRGRPSPGAGLLSKRLPLNSRGPLESLTATTTRMQHVKHECVSPRPLDGSWATGMPQGCVGLLVFVLTVLWQC